MSILNRQTIRRQVLAGTCLLLVPLAVAVAWSMNQTRLERENEVREQAGSVAITAAALLDQYFRGLDAMASALVHHPAVLALDAERSGEVFKELLRNQPLLTNLVLTAPDGALRGSGETSEPTGRLVRPWVDEVVRTRQPVVSDLDTGGVSGKPILTLAYPVFSEGRDTQGVIGVLGLAIDLSQLQSLFTRIPLPDDSVVALLDRRGRIVARSREPEKFIGVAVEPEPVDITATARPVMLVGVDGVERFHGHAAVDRGPWLLSVGIPRAVVGQRLFPLWRRSLTIFVSGVVGLVLLTLWIGGMITRHVNRLRSAAQHIADGDLSPPLDGPAPNLELGQLQAAFTRMAASLRDARDALDHQMRQERKMNEALQSLQRQVVRQERLAAVGLLVSGVAHELNNPLQAILGTAELLEREPGFSQGTLDEIAFLKTQSGRAREIIRNLSRFSNQQSGPPALVDLKDVVAEVVQLRRRDLDNASIQLEVVLASLRKVHANFTELEQVTLNFVINAQQSIDANGAGKGRILIKLFDTGKKVRLEVHDNGGGVKEEDEPKLFQPFFTTKPVGKGTGLGLSVSYGIIDSHGGAIGHRGNDWGGATFFFELPAHEVGDDAPGDRPAALRGSTA